MIFVSCMLMGMVLWVSGEFSDHWDCTGYEGDQRIIYCTETEYRIPVEWFIRLDRNPIRATDLEDIIGFKHTQTLQRITKPGAADRLLDLAGGGIA